MVASGAARKRQDAPDPVLNGAGDTGDGAPQIPVLRSVTGAEDKRVPAFSINGTTYYISTRPKVNKAIRYLHLTRTQGTEIAIDFMLGELLGEEGYEALMNFDDLTAEQLREVVNIASKVMTGAVEVPKDKQKNG